jgi:hypothetical protein
MIRTLLAATVLFLAAARAEGKEIQLYAGMPVADAVKTLRGIADDLSSGLQVSAGPNGKPSIEFCWKLRDYDLVVWLYGAADGKILSFGLWTKKKFNEPKWERYDQEVTARRITLDTEKHVFKVEKFPAYFPKELLNNYEQAGLAPILFAANEPILTTNERNRGYFAFRVLYFSRNSAPDVAVRYETKGGRCYRRSVVLRSEVAAKAAESREIEVPKKEVETLIASLEKSGFWKMPKDDPVDALNQFPGQDNTGKDGSRIIIETIKDGQHRVRARWSPGYKVEERGLLPLVKMYMKLFQDTGLWKKD